MSKHFLSIALLACVAAATPPLAAQMPSPVSITAPWVRGTVPAQKATGAFMQITATQPLRLVSASTPVAGIVELHEMTHADHVMRMRQVASIDVTPGRTTELKPGGHHVMLMDLKQALPAGQTVPLTLTFEAADGRRFTQEVKAPVQALGAQAAQPHKPHMAH